MILSFDRSPLAHWVQMPSDVLVARSKGKNRRQDLGDRLFLSQLPQCLLQLPPQGDEELALGQSNALARALKANEVTFGRGLITAAT